MDSVRRYRQDASLDIEPLDSASDNHPIRHHRRKNDSSLSRGLTAVAVVGILATFLSTSVVAIGTRSTPTPHAVLLPPVAMVPEVTEPLGPPIPTQKPPTVPESKPEGSERAARSAQRAATSRVEAVIAFALAQQGDRYRFGSAGPNTYDCSGLVMRAFEQVGIKLPHYTGTMISRGTRVIRSEMQRGDIVFLSSHHVAIYLGDGMMVAASSGKGRVIVQKVYSFYAARRLL